MVLPEMTILWWFRRLNNLLQSSEIFIQRLQTILEITIGINSSFFHNVYWLCKKKRLMDYTIVSSSIIFRISEMFFTSEQVTNNLFLRSFKEKRFGFR